MAFVFNKVLNPSNFADDAFAVSNLWPLTSGTIGFAYEQPTSLGAAPTTTQIYTRIYTISGSTLSSQVAVSGSGSVGFFAPSFVGNSDNTIQLVGYSAGNWINPYSGFAVKESADSGATWANTYSGGGSYPNDAHRGLYRDYMTGDVYLVTQAIRVGNYKVTVHKRTGAGTWTTSLAYTGSSSNYYNLDGTPQQNAIFFNGKALIVGPKTDGSIYALHSTDQITWTETLVAAHSDFTQRQCKLLRSADGTVRLMVQGAFSPSLGGFSPPSIYYTSDMGATWITIGIPPGLFMEDQNGNDVGWSDSDEMAFTLDGRGRMYITLGDVNRPYLQTFRAWSTAYTSWGMVGTDSISDGSGNTYSAGDLSRLPSPSLVVGSDIYRVVCAWISGSNCAQAWMLKNAGGAVAAGGRTGGGGQPRSYSAGD